MKSKFTLIICLLLMAGPGTIGAMETDISVHTGLYYDGWQSNAGTSGGQFYCPAEIEGRFDHFSVNLLTAYMIGDYHSDAGGDKSLTTLLDTKINLSYEITEAVPLDLLFGLDLNLPTGRTGLEDHQLVLVMDPDLVPITRYGEGFNINPTLTAVKSWRAWIAGISAGYAWRGEYDFSATTQDYQPGNIINLAAETRYTLSPAWQVLGFAGYAYYGPDQVRGEDFYQEGAFLTIGAGLHHFRKSWQADVSLAGLFRSKGRFLSGSRLSAMEEQNNQGDEWVLNAGGSYFLTPKTTLKARAAYLRVGDNGLDGGSPYHTGGRQKISLQAILIYAFSDHLQCELRLKGFTMNEDKSWDHPDDTRSYQGGSVAVGASYAF